MFGNMPLGAKKIMFSILGVVVAWIYVSSLTIMDVDLSVKIERIDRSIEFNYLSLIKFIIILYIFGKISSFLDEAKIVDISENWWFWGSAVPMIFAPMIIFITQEFRNGILEERQAALMIMNGYSVHLIIFIFNAPIRIFSYLSEHPIFRRWFHFGTGENARWAGPRSFSESQIFFSGKSFVDGLYTGRNLLQDNDSIKQIGMKDDSHQVTIAATGAGKSISAVWPNLLLYNGPLLVLDPKGEHANFAAKRRKSFILDPYRNTKFSGSGGILSAFTSSGTHRYNPLSEIDIKDDASRGLIQAVADGCVLEEGSGDNIHFTESARTIIEGVIAHVLSQHPKRHHNLPYVADLFRGLDPELGVADPKAFEELVVQMSANDAAGGLPMDAAGVFINAADRERGSIMTTCFRSLKWINDPPMKKTLAKSDFSALDIIGSRTNALYIVLPFERMSESSQIRWMRVLINMFNVLLFRNPRTESMGGKMLFIFDEFAKLRYMRMIEEGIVTTRGAGAKYWILIQNLGQLRQHYNQNWETFLGASNVQVFGLGNDAETSKWTAEALGGLHEAGSGNYPLLRPDEVKQFLGKDEPTQIVIRSTGPPMRLERLAYKPIKRYKGIEGLRGMYDD